jgi:hypothetical protein
MLLWEFLVLKFECMRHRQQSSPLVFGKKKKERDKQHVSSKLIKHTLFCLKHIYNTKNNIFNINNFDYSKNNNIHNTNNTIFNSKNI